MWLCFSLCRYFALHVLALHALASLFGCVPVLLCTPAPHCSTIFRTVCLLWSALLPRSFSCMPCPHCLVSPQVSEDEGGVGATDDGGEGIAATAKAKRNARKRRESRRQRGSVATSVATSVVEDGGAGAPGKAAPKAPPPTKKVPSMPPAPASSHSGSPAPAPAPAPTAPSAHHASAAAAAAAALVSPIAVSSSVAAAAASSLPSTHLPVPGAKQRGPAPKVAAPSAPKAAPAAPTAAPSGLSSSLPSIAAGGGAGAVAASVRGLAYALHPEAVHLFAADCSLMGFFVVGCCRDRPGEPCTNPGPTPC
jgi:hypothetical protein